MQIPYSHISVLEKLNDSVFKARLKGIKSITHEIVLVKKLDFENLRREYENLNRINEIPELKPFVVKPLGKFHDEEIEMNTGIIIAWESYGNLKEYLASNPTLSLGQKIVLIESLSDGLRRLHKNKICHYDIKPSNILIRWRHIKSKGGYPRIAIKFADFGEAQFNPLENARPVRGTKGYSAPELSDPKIAFKNPYAVDVFSFGVVVLEIFSNISGVITPESMNCITTVHETNANLSERLLSFDERVYKIFQQFISNCMEKQQDERPSANECYSFCRNLYEEYKRLQINLFFSRKPACDILLSYSPENFELVNSLYIELTKRAYRVSMRFVYNDRNRETNKAIFKNCKVFIPIIDKNYADNSTSRREFHDARMQNKLIFIIRHGESSRDDPEVEDWLQDLTTFNLPVDYTANGSFLNIVSSLVEKLNLHKIAQRAMENDDPTTTCRIQSTELALDEKNDIEMTAGNI